MEPTAGTRFNKWTVLEDREYRSKRVPCRCDCGVEKVVQVSNLKSGKSKCCGCTHVVRKHGAGYADYRYRAWRRIKQKCLESSSQDYAYYGGRGITMHPAWVADFLAFAAYLDEHLGERFEGLTLDRIDNEGNYEPGNLRWATRAQQAMNRRNRWRSREDSID